MAVRGSLEDLLNLDTSRLKCVMETDEATRLQKWTDKGLLLIVKLRH